MKILLLPLLLVLSTARPARSQDPHPSDPASWKARIESERRARDDEFRSREWSALAVVAIAPLDRPRLVIGSGPDADLRLDGNEVAPVHAELVRGTGASGKPHFRVRELGGKVGRADGTTLGSEGAPLEANARVRIGSYQVYWSTLGTFGPVLRALDFSSPAYTRFDGLRYFPPDPRYRVAAQVAPYTKSERIIIGDTQGWQRPAWRYGEAAFSLSGRDLKLVLLVFTPEPSEKDTFFVAFSDVTSGGETYPAGRYLTPAFVRSGPLFLDFNLAKNPLCAYNTGFACPLPPRENRLRVEVRAGEKIYPHAAGRH